MSNAQTFFESVAINETLREELIQALNGKQGDDALRAICEVANSHGFALTMEDTAAALAALHRVHTGDRELGDTELESVAGGLGLFITAAIALTSGAMTATGGSIMIGQTLFGKK